MTDNLRVCRVCLESEMKEKLSPIFSDSGKNKIAHNIFVLSGIQIIDIENEIPALICKGCVEDLSRAIYLRKLCIKSNLKFKKLISESASKRVETTLNEPLNEMKEEYLEEFFIKTEFEDGAYTEEYFNPNQNFVTTEMSHIGQHYDHDDDDLSNSLIRNYGTKREPFIANEPMVPMNSKPKYQKGKLHKCNYCVKMFVSKFSASQHAKTMHEVLSPADYFICDLCGAQLKLKHYLRPHFNRKHLNLHNHVFPCTFCGKTLTSNYSRRQHEKMLHKQSPKESPDFECHLCGHTAKRKAYIYKHMMTVHIKKYDYICPICTKNFCTATSLKNHISCVHKKLKPHACPHCEKCFAVPDGLRNHIRSHTQEKPFTCEICHEGFKYRKGYRDHRKRYHQDSIDQTQSPDTSYNWSAI